MSLMKKMFNRFSFAIVLFTLFSSFIFTVFGQENHLIDIKSDSLPYELYNHKVILFSDFGYASAPFSLRYNYPGEVEKLKFRNNYQSVLGFGFCYKWLTIRLFKRLQQSTKSEEKFGTTKHAGLGITFSIKNTYWDIDLRSFTGYAIKSAYKWNDTLSNEVNPNDIRTNTVAGSFRANGWYFDNKDFKMDAVFGKRGRFTKSVKSFYLKGSFNIYGVSNGNESIIPSELIDIQNSKTASPFYSAIDLGVLPGFAYANNIKNWQFSTMVGLGGVIQNKFYNSNGNLRANIGLAPRYDIRFIVGYTVPRYFIFLLSDIDNKSIRFNSLVYRQSFYSLSLVGGIRLDTKKEKRRRKER